MSTIVIALGGNALIAEKEQGTVEEQKKHLQVTAKHLVRLIPWGYKLVLTHGNGPQVGNLLIQQERAKKEVPALTMDVCGAATQGTIGYLLEQALLHELQATAIPRQIACLVTHTLVSLTDPAFLKPTKPVGPWYQARDIQDLQKRGYTFIVDHKQRYRRVVPSPQPLRIVQLDTIKLLIRQNVLVIAAGGGGIPVVEEQGSYRGIEAVIDKDMTSAILANGLGASLLMILTGVEYVYCNFGTAQQKPLKNTTTKEVEKLLHQGEFGTGSMEPKIRAALQFLNAPWKKVIITHPYSMLEALAGKTGTHITKS